MPEIVLTEEQARVLAGASGPVVVRRPGGAAVGAIDPREAEVIAESDRRKAAGRSAPAEAVRQRLAALQAEWDRGGPFDAARLRELLDRLRAEAGDD